MAGPSDDTPDTPAEDAGEVSKPNVNEAADASAIQSGGQREASENEEEEEEEQNEATRTRAEEPEPVIVHRTMPKYGDRIVLPPGRSTHEEPAPYVGPGWVCRIAARKAPGGGPKADRHWLNADRSARLRSIAEVERYLNTEDDAANIDGDGSDGDGGDGSASDDEAEGRPVRKKARTRTRTRSQDNQDDEEQMMDTDDEGNKDDNGGEDDVSSSSSSDDGPDPINPLINSAVALSRGRIHFSSAAQAAVGALLNSKTEDGSSQTYAYSWDSILGLDLDGSNHVVGTAAMSEYLDSQGRERGVGRSDGVPSASASAPAAAVTPSQILEMIHTLRPRTCRPPDGSGLVDVVHNAPSENALWYGMKAGASASVLDQYAEEVDRKIHQKTLATGKLTGEQDTDQDDTKGKGNAAAAERDLIVPYSALSRLYETMCQQDATSPQGGGGGESTFRRDCRYMTAPKVVETLRQYENGMAELDKRERDAMEVGKGLGLLGNDGNNGIGSDVAKYGYSSTS